VNIDEQMVFLSQEAAALAKLRPDLGPRRCGECAVFEDLSAGHDPTLFLVPKQTPTERRRYFTEEEIRRMPEVTASKHEGFTPQAPLEPTPGVSDVIYTLIKGAEPDDLG
jgi:hypothetical protein